MADFDIIGFAGAPPVQAPAPTVAPVLRHHVAVGPANLLHGWAYDAARPYERLVVRVVLEQRWGLPPIDAGSFEADRPSHLVAIGDGLQVPCGFECRVPVQADAVTIRVFELASNTELDGSPMHFGVAPQFEGFLDGIVGRCATGWAWATSLNYRAEVDVYLDRRYVATALAVERRDDLVAAGIGHGVFAFNCPLPATAFDGGKHEVACFFHGTERHLGGSPLHQVLSLTGLHAAIGPDRVLRGGLDLKVAVERPRLYLLLDRRPLMTLAPQPAPAPGPAGRPSYRFAVPVPYLPGRLEIALAEEAIAGEPRDWRPAPAAAPAERRRDPVLLSPQPVAVFTDAPAPPLPPAEPTVAAREQAHVAKEAAARRLPRQSKLLVPVWGDAYIAMFCQLCLPSLLSDNNLPRYVERHRLTVTILTRSGDVNRFDQFPAMARLRRLTRVEFLPIDEVLTQYFDPRPADISSMALTYAFFHGIRASGAAATETDFIFWNSDFLAADGTFATLAEIVARGGRCTMSASLRADLAILDVLRARLGDGGTKLTMSARELVRLALAHPHPTVEAQAVNRHPDKLLGTIINRLCWQIGDDVLIGRFFLLYMLHIRPERVWDDVNGPCDYTFVPEMVPNDAIVYECNSDRMCIIEPQDRAKESFWINSDRFDIAAVARWIDYWATTEHVAFSKNLVVFNGGDREVEQLTEFAPAAAALDGLMNEIYARLDGERIWHNLHVYWRGNYSVLQREVPPPGPDRPRSRTANIARWSGYDLDLLHDSWGDAPGGPRELYAACPALGDGRTGAWLDELFEAYIGAWLADPAVRIVDQNPVSLSYVHYGTREQRIVTGTEFYGCRWGPPERVEEVWYRRLGPAGDAILLHRVSQRSGFEIELTGRCFGKADLLSLVIAVNGRAPCGRIDSGEGGGFAIRLYISQQRVVECEGRLVIAFLDTRPAAGGFGFAGYRIQPCDLCDRELEDMSSSGFLPGNGSAPSFGEPVVPSLAVLRAREAQHSDGSEDCVEMDLAGGFLGLGWAPPFKRAGNLWRWAAGDGAELLIVRLGTGRDWDIELVANRDLSDVELVTAVAIEANGRDLPGLQVVADPDTYRLRARLHRNQVAVHGGWVALRLLAQRPAATLGEPAPAPHGGGRIEFGEPAAGGIALGRFRARPAEADLTPLFDVLPRSPREPVATFWRQRLAALISAASATLGPRRRACRMLGVDWRCYEAALRHYGGRVAASWACCQPDAGLDLAMAEDWLAAVDREIAEAWHDGGGAIQSTAFARRVGDGLEGTGFGEPAGTPAGSGRRLPGRHALTVFLRLSRDMPWWVELDLYRDPDDDSADVVAVYCGAQRLPAATTRLAGDIERIGVAIAERQTGDDGLVIELAAPCDGRTLLGLRAIPDAAPLRPPAAGLDFARFIQVATQFGIDPLPYLAASRRSRPEFSRALAACPEYPLEATDFATALLAYYDYMLAASLRLKDSWKEGAGTIDLVGDFDGVGWGLVGSFAGRLGRRVGPAGSAAILLHAGAVGPVVLAVACVGPVGGTETARVEVSANGTKLTAIEEIIDEDCCRLVSVFALEAPGNLVLRLSVPVTEAERVGFASASLRRADAAEAENALGAATATRSGPAGAAISVPAGGEGGAALAAAAGLRLPPPDAQLDRLPGIAKQDAILWRFGRDPLLYRAWIDHSRGALALLFDSCPTPARWVAPDTQAWLDLVDRTMVEALISGTLDPGPLCPVLGELRGLGWGPLTMCCDGLARQLSGGGDAILFLPPNDAAGWHLDLAFASDSDRRSLLKLKVSANRREPLRQTVVFEEDGPRLEVEIDADAAEFGLGWVAVRLWLDLSQQYAVGASFRSAAPLIEAGIAVRTIGLRPRQTAALHAARQQPLARDLPAAIHCVVPAWGAEYLKTYLEVCLPAHLASGNLGALPVGGRVYEIYTDAEGRAAIERHPLCSKLAAAVDELAFYDIGRFRSEKRHAHVHQLNLNYAVMNEAHQDAIARASARGGALLFLNCDTVYSADTFARLRELWEDGYRSVENLSIRTDRDAMLTALQPFRTPADVIAVSSAALTQLALPRLHAIARARYWKGPPGLVIPDHLYWPAAESALLARATHWMPLFVFPRARDVAYLGTIDHGFIPASGVSREERWFMTAQEEPSSYELSLPQHDQRFPPFERGSARDMARFLGRLCEGFHLRNLDRPVHIAADPLPPAHWCELEEESAEVIARIRQRLQKYALTPWRPDTETEAEESELIWAADLPLREVTPLLPAPARIA